MQFPPRGEWRVHLRGTQLGRSWLEKETAAVREKGMSCLTIIAL